MRIISDLIYFLLLHFILMRRAVKVDGTYLEIYLVVCCLEVQWILHGSSLQDAYISPVQWWIGFSCNNLHPPWHHLDILPHFHGLISTIHQAPGSSQHTLSGLLIYQCFSWGPNTGEQVMSLLISSNGCIRFSITLSIVIWACLGRVGLISSSEQ